MRKVLTLFLRKGSAFLFVGAKRGHFYSGLWVIKSPFNQSKKTSLDLANGLNQRYRGICDNLNPDIGVIPRLGAQKPSR